MTLFRLLPFAFCLTLAACGEGQNTRDLLGLGRNAPDEFRVVSRPPLSIPPDFALRPPAEGVDTTNLPDADITARAMLTGNDEETLTGKKQVMGDAETAVGTVESFDLESDADQGFLSNIGAEKAEDNIREKIDHEQARRDAAVQKELDSSFGWLTPGASDASGTIVDAEKEKARLKDNAKAGKNPAEGETPSVNPDVESVLEKLF